eukprot:gene25627-biopygen9046
MIFAHNLAGALQDTLHSKLSGRSGAREAAAAALGSQDTGAGMARAIGNHWLGWRGRGMGLSYDPCAARCVPRGDVPSRRSVQGDVRIWRPTARAAQSKVLAQHRERLR